MLLVEDDEANPGLLSRQLQHRSYDMTEAVDGRQGPNLADAEAADLMLMDMTQPMLDGRAETSFLKADPSTASIPMIALTAHSTSSNHERSLDAGFDDYDTKPVDLSHPLFKIEVLGEPGLPKPCADAGREHRFERAEPIRGLNQSSAGDETEGRMRSATLLMAASFA